MYKDNVSGIYMYKEMKTQNYHIKECIIYIYKTSIRKLNNTILSSKNSAEEWESLNFSAWFIKSVTRRITSLLPLHAIAREISLGCVVVSLNIELIWFLLEHAAWNKTYVLTIWNDWKFPRNRHSLKIVIYSSQWKVAEFAYITKGIHLKCRGSRQKQTFYIGII